MHTVAALLTAVPPSSTFALCSSPTHGASAACHVGLNYEHCSARCARAVAWGCTRLALARRAKGDAGHLVGTAWSVALRFRLRRSRAVHPRVSLRSDTLTTRLSVLEATSWCVPPTQQPIPATRERDFGRQRPAECVAACPSCVARPVQQVKQPWAVRRPPAIRDEHVSCHNRHDAQHRQSSAAQTVGPPLMRVVRWRARKINGPR